MIVDDDKRAELLMDHYKDSFSLLHGHWKSRNRLFLYALVLIAVIGLDTLSPGSLAQWVNGYVKSKIIGEDPSWKALDFTAVDLMARFVLLWVVIQYFQRSILVDRSYSYLHRLEERICELMGPGTVTREGTAYRSRRGAPDDVEDDTPGEKQPDYRPKFLQWVGPLYVFVFPVALGLGVIAKSWHDLATSVSVASLLSTACSLGIVVYSGLYVFWAGWRK